SGTGKNAYVPGYHVAGKTGTSDKLNNKGQYVASFVGFAPADDPKIAVLAVLDEPQGEAHGGGAVAAPVAGEVFEQILPYLGIEPAYTDDELKHLICQTPAVLNKGVQEAKAELMSEGFTVKVVGNGQTVVGQCPEGGSIVPRNGVVALYTEANYTVQNAKMPKLTGLSVTEANRAGLNAALNVKISGSSLSGSGAVAYRQSVNEGDEIPIGTVVTVYFKSNIDVSD
ncbi:MAG: penicillin-binding transpeptidase domain-containing protein, partial [Oscillospiraceae bacterium]|nr:penicillin-binding transpeptidase domain-containing protein [Oscillospiraceae bacterium]